MKKKRAIFTIVAGSIAVVFLSGILLVGLSSNGFGLMAAQASSDEHSYGYDNVITLDPEENVVAQLEISWEAGPVEVKAVPAGKIRITESSGHKLEESEQMQVRINGNKLEISWDHSRFKLFSLNFFGMNSKSLVVELPQEVASQLTEIDCSNISGDMDISGLTGTEGEFSSVSGALRLSKLAFSEDCGLSTTSGDIILKDFSSENLDASTTSGMLRFADTIAEEMHCHSVSGEIDVEGAAQKFDSSSVSGSSRAALSACPEEVKMESVSGAIIVELPSNASFTVEHVTVSGSFSSDFPSTDGKGGKRVCGTGKPSGELSFSTTSGNMQVLKASAAG